MKKKRIIAIISLILFVVIGITIYKNISIEKNKNEYQDYIPEEEITEEQMRKSKVVLYFENNDTKELDTEIQLIDAKQLIENPYNKLIEYLIKGPQNQKLSKLIPEGTFLHGITLDGSNAILNLSNEFLNYGDENNKLKIITSITKTLKNFKEIDSIKILINGEENEKFNEIYI